jgi:hypothetical protein
VRESDTHINRHSESEIDLNVEFEKEVEKDDLENGREIGERLLSLRQQ